MIPQNQDSTETIGCVVKGTRISGGILIILGSVVLLLLALMLIRGLRLSKDRQRYLKQDKTVLPFDLADWQLAAYHQRDGKRPRSSKEISKIEYLQKSTEDEPALKVKMTLARSPKKAEMQELTWSNFHKFDWEDQGDVEYHTQYLAHEPWVEVQERSICGSNSQQSTNTS